MSGSNPFRRRKPAADPVPESSQRDQESEPKPPSSQLSASGAGSTSVALQPDLPSRATAPRPQKTVRIASPPVTPSDSPPLRGAPLTALSGQYSSFKGQPIAHRGSPPPALLSGPHSGRLEDDDGQEDDVNDAVDPFNLEVEASSDSDEEGSQEEAQWDSTAREEGSITAAVGERPSHRRTVSSNAAQAVSASLPTDGSRTKRATMDVDAFKRLLLTGDAGSTLGLDARNDLPDPASLSRQPTTSSFHGEPRANPGIVPQAQGDPGKPISGQTGSGEKKKPPPPKTRHGKLIRSSDSSMPPPASTASISAPSISTSSSPDVRPRAGSASSEQYPKPLPPTPPSQGVATSLPVPIITTDEVPAPATSQIKRPPTPPLTRRHSQMRREQTSGISRSNSTRAPVSPSSQEPPHLLRRSSLPKTPPPPPFSRRSEHESTVSPPPSISYGKQRHSSDQDASGGVSDLQENGAPDGPTLRRSALGSVKDPSRKSSGSMVPPRPPPPRRNAGSSSSNRASLDEVRPSFEPGITAAQDQIAIDGIESQRAQSNASDILADLSRLQKEVDDLRGQYAGRNSSA